MRTLMIALLTTVTIVPQSLAQDYNAAMLEQQYSMTCAAPNNPFTATMCASMRVRLDTMRRSAGQSDDDEESEDGESSGGGVTTGMIIQQQQIMQAQQERFMEQIAEKRRQELYQARLASERARQSARSSGQSSGQPWQPVPSDNPSSQSSYGRATIDTCNNPPGVACTIQ